MVIESIIKVIDYKIFIYGKTIQISEKFQNKNNCWDASVYGCAMLW
jgi:hypothetical protein